jgi:phosphatidylserine synthase 2
MLPNFNECWWDSIIMDVLVCNTIGIYLGMKSVKYFDGKTYEWIGLSRQRSFSGKVWRSLGQFTPAYWDKDEWNPLQGPVRFLQVLGLVVLILAVEVECFFLKYCLWVPPLNPLVTYRLIIWWLIANPAIREYNTFLQTRKSMKLGAFCWLVVAISIVETLICIKFGRGLYPQPMPGYVFWSLISAVVALVLFLGWWTMNIYLVNRMERDFVEENTKKTI